METGKLIPLSQAINRIESTEKGLEFWEALKVKEVKQVNLNGQLFVYENQVSQYLLPPDAVTKKEVQDVQAWFEKVKKRANL